LVRPTSVRASFSHAISHFGLQSTSPLLTRFFSVANPFFFDRAPVACLHQPVAQVSCEYKCQCLTATCRAGSTMHWRCSWHRWTQPSQRRYAPCLGLDKGQGISSLLTLQSPSFTAPAGTATFNVATPFFALRTDELRMHWRQGSTTLTPALLHTSQRSRHLRQSSTRQNWRYGLASVWWSLSALPALRPPACWGIS
jgi:hypothetical protein